MDAPIVLSRDQSRRVDEIAVRDFGFSSLVLMENAGRGVVDVLLALDPALTSQQSSVAILCGKGNNAGDGFVIARHLAIRGANPLVLLLCSPGELAGDARANYEILARCGAPLVDLSTTSKNLGALESSLNEHAGGGAWLVDAMLGTGARGEPREPFRTAIAWMNTQSGRRLAVDLPSGLDCDSGTAASTTVRADATCTFATVKLGLIAESAAAFVGQLQVVSIGVPAAVLRQAARG